MHTCYGKILRSRQICLLADAKTTNRCLQQTLRPTSGCGSTSSMCVGYITLAFYRFLIIIDIYPCLLFDDKAVDVVAFIFDSVTILCLIERCRSTTRRPTKLTCARTLSDVVVCRSQHARCLLSRCLPHACSVSS